MRAAWTAPSAPPVPLRAAVRSVQVPPVPLHAGLSSSAPCRSLQFRSVRRSGPRQVPPVPLRAGPSSSVPCGGQVRSAVRSAAAPRSLPEQRLGPWHAAVSLCSDGKPLAVTDGQRSRHHPDPRPAIATRSPIPDRRSRHNARSLHHDRSEPVPAARPGSCVRLVMARGTE